MQKSFIEALNSEIEYAKERYQEAKKEVLSNLKDNNSDIDLIREVNTFYDFGAAYAMRVDNLTKYATKIKTLYEVKQMYEWYQKEENKND